jgi:hypothetical protein
MLKKKAFLAGILITTLLVGCTGNANSTSSSETSAKSTGEFSGVKLVYWSNWEATEPQGVVITAAVEEFKKETGAEVDLQFKGRKGIKEGLIPALDAEQQVDLFDGQNNKSNYGDRIISLEDLVKENDYEKDTNPVLIKLCRSYHEGKLKEIPYQMKANGYLYNKALFEKAGVKEVPKNWEEFLKACQALKDADITPITTDDAYATQAFGMHLARLIGSDEVKKVVNNGEWDRPEVLKTAKCFEELAAKGYFSKQVGSNVWPNGQNTELATGKAALYCSGTYIPNETKTITGDSFQWGFFNYPEVDGGINGTEAMVLGCQSFAITSKCKNPKAAFALIKKLTRGSWDAKLAEETLSIPADIHNTAWPKQLADARPYMEKCTEIFAVSGGLENNPDVTPALKENLMKLYAGTCTAEEFVANMKK